MQVKCPNCTSKYEMNKEDLIRPMTTIIKGIEMFSSGINLTDQQCPVCKKVVDLKMV